MLLVRWSACSFRNVGIGLGESSERHRGKVSLPAREPSYIGRGIVVGVLLYMLKNALKPSCVARRLELRVLARWP